MEVGDKQLTCLLRLLVDKRQQRAWDVCVCGGGLLLPLLSVARILVAGVTDE